MDSIISTALEEICIHRGGLTLSSLYHNLKINLKIELSTGLKRAIWSNLINVPTIEFKVQNKVYSPNDTSIQLFEDAERLNFKIVAKQVLWDNFLGLYDFPHAITKLSTDQRRSLELIAITRTNGITQKQLSDELGIERNKTGYEAKKLASAGLIVRQPAEERTKEACNAGELKNSSNWHTNLIHLPRYAKHLGSQQKFEITKEEQTMNTDSREGVKDHVFVKDFLPEMNAICDKLEEANGKVLVVSDIKRDLGYIGERSRHRAWGDISRRLKNGHVVEEFNAEVNGKVECCLRLLKKFSLKNFLPKSLGCGDDEQPVKFGRRQNTEQLVELSIEHQMYDVIDTKGSEGLTSIEVSKRFGIDNKVNRSRLCNMIKRFGMHRQRELLKRSEAYRVWTAGNFNLESSNAFPSRSKNVLGESSNLDIPDRSAETFLQHDPSTFEGNFATCGKMNDKEADLELSSSSPRSGKANHILLCPGNSQELLQEPRGKVAGAEPDLASTVMETNIAPSETIPPPLLKPPKSGSYQRDPSQFLTADGARREQRILERLHDEKFILKAELYRWLVSLEKDKGTTMGRKTLNRNLHKLEQQGHCKCIPLAVPAIRNCASNFDVQVVLHPSVQSLSPELINEVHDKLGSFKRKIRGLASCELKDNESIPVLDGVKRSETYVGSDALAVRLEAMCGNGFIVGKIVRAKLLHSFLWNYTSRSPGWSGALSSGKHVGDLKNPCSPQHLFNMEAAIKDIPLELFLQVMGTTKTIDEMIEKCKKGFCLSDLPVQEYNYLKDTKASGRLSSIISILQQLKLIRLVTSGHSEVRVNVPRVTPVYAMELKTYIEEPPSITATSSTLDLCPRIRHDFVLSNREAVDEYWQTLEYIITLLLIRKLLHMHSLDLHNIYISEFY